MSAATVRLLEAAAALLGGEAQLAGHLHISDFLLKAYLEDRRELPDPMLLKAVDVILKDVPSLQTPVSARARLHQPARPIPPE